MPEPNITPAGGKIWLIACAAILGFVTSGAATGQQFCSEPVTPYCADENSKYDTILQINRCKDDLGDYEEELNDYEACIEESLKRMRSELEQARSDLQEAEKQF